MSAPPAPIGLPGAALDRLMPMHALLTARGALRRAGPTLQKLCPGTPLAGRDFLDVFELRGPGRSRRLADLFAAEGASLDLRLRAAPATRLKGIAARVSGGEELLVDMSFGISVADAVTEFGLTIGDFAATDLTVEMLYLIEAKSAVFAESRELNRRLERARVAAEEQAFTDTLTGLKNRRAMDNILARMVGRAEAFALLHLDLDYFKEVNDSLGHAAGDRVLQFTAQVLVAETRDRDTVARVGGDEYVILLAGLSDRAQIVHIAERLITRLEQPTLFEGRTCCISASIGYTTFPGVARCHAAAPAMPEALREEADIALYASKRAGRARVTGMNDALRG